MKSLIDHSLVVLALFVSTGYALYSLGPRSLTRRLQRMGAGVLARLPAFVGMRRLAQRLSDRSAVDGGAACGGCDHCGADSAGVQPPSPDEVRVPLTQIGRRS